MIITTIVSFVRQNEVNDIFKIARINSITHESAVEYVEYPRSMNLTEDDIYNELGE